MAETYLDGNGLFVDPDAMCGLRSVIRTTASARTLTDKESNSVVIQALNSATQTFTLPSAAVAGRQFTFICGGASGECLINPATGEKIVLQVLSAIGADADTAQISNTTTGIKNTAATNVLGDSITLMSDGVDTWFSTVGLPTGIWATQ